VTTTLTDAEVDSLAPSWEGTAEEFVLRALAPPHAAPGLLVLQNMTTLHDLDDLDLLVEGLATDGTRATDAGGFTVRGETVEAWDAGDHRVALSRAALARVLARLAETAAAHRGR
jgi:hypothetical protein